MTRPGSPRLMLAVACLVALARPAASGSGKAFFHLVEERGAWWLEDGAGKRIYSTGVTGVTPGVGLDAFDPAAPSYCALRFNPSLEGWRQAALKRLGGWGFNTLGFGAEEVLTAGHVLPYLVTLNLGTAAGAPWGDPASLSARTRYREVLARIAKLREDPLLIGYCLDGQLGWWDEGLFLHVLRQPVAKEALKARLFERLTAEYRGDLRLFAEDFALEPEPKKFADLAGAFRKASFRPGRRPLLVEEFVGAVARDFYRTATEELRRVDPNHLVFSDRFASFYAQPVARAAGEFVDAIATTWDSPSPAGWAAPFYFESLARIARKPILVAETSFAAMQNRSGDRNSHGGYVTVATQPERAAGAAAAWAGLARFGSVVGAHWFQFADQPPESGGAEDFNMGLVDLKDSPYEELTAALTRANAAAPAAHGSWPAGAGLVRAPQGLLVPGMADLPIINGSLEDWALDRAWIPGVAAAAPFERFGDFFVTWHPEGLVVAVVYMDYRARQRAVDGPEQDAERFTLGIGAELEKPVVFTLKGLQEKVDPEKPDLGFRTPEVLAVRGGVPFPAESRFLVAQGAHGLFRVVEIFLPAALFRREKLEAGDILRAAASLRLRANFKELFWPHPFKVTSWQDSAGWVPLVLQALPAGQEAVPKPPPAPVAPPAASPAPARVTAPATPAATPSPAPAAKPTAKPAPGGKGKPAGGKKP